MDDELPPIPPLPLGDQAGVPADVDTLRGILHRHRRRQVAGAALALVVVLVAGGAAGFAVGHTTTGTVHGTQVAAGEAPTPSGGPAASAPLAAGSSGAAVGPSGTHVLTLTAPKATQLLVRDAVDGVRVRLYERDMALPQVACPAGATCAQPATPACAPTSIVTAEVSTDQVAGTTGAPVWAPSSGAALDLVTVGVVGAGEPQPILTVVAKATSAVAKVTLTTPYGADHASSTDGWVALAVQLPADVGTSGGDPLATSTLVATDAAGTTLISTGLSPGPGAVPPCGPCLAVGAPARGAPAVATGGKGAVSPAIAPLPCPLPCAPVPPSTGSNTGAPVPNIAMCVSGGGSGGGSASGSAGSATVGPGSVSSTGSAGTASVGSGTVSSGSGSSSSGASTVTPPTPGPPTDAGAQSSSGPTTVVNP
jgi:hypothetical protein